MTALILAFIGFALITGALFSLYRSSNEAISIDEKSETEIDITNKKIDVLSDEIQETKEQIVETDNKDLSKPEVLSQFSGQNIPIIEIKDIDLGESSDLADDEPRKKGQRITYVHQLKFSIVNVGKFSLKEVIFSVKDIYNDPKEGKSKKKAKEYNYMGRTFANEDVGAYNNIEVNTLNLKSKKLVYVSNLPTSFGVGDYYFDIIVEWNNGFYQMHVDIEEVNGKLKYRYQFYDVDGKPINLKSSEEVTA
ncbi:hypothetical protein [Flavobacterium sp.]|uniref:hypothetical protein n=1 Tax=Flavobacterium sp. TaxID=239 RepID=UPI00260E9867|nr:hypothetical protein [Flavobacterium sp.]